MVTVFFRNTAHLLRDLEAVNSMKEVEVRKGFANFVFLKVAYKVPAKGAWEICNFCECFLNATFAEKGLSIFDESADGFGRVSFRYSD